MSSTEQTGHRVLESLDLVKVCKKRVTELWKSIQNGLGIGVHYM